MSRGQSRIDYPRTYVLLPPSAGTVWAKAVVDATWDKHHFTLGGSADDAGIGNLSVRRVLAVNPLQWQGSLEVFFKKYYPDVDYQPVTAASPDELRRKLQGKASPPTPTTKVLLGFNDPDDLGAGNWMIDNNVRTVLYIPLFLGDHPRYLDYSCYVSEGIRIIVNLRYSWSVDCGGAGTLPGQGRERLFVRACIETVKNAKGIWGYTIANEVNNLREHPRGFTLTPGYVADVYNNVLSGVAENVKVSPGPVDPFYGPGSDNSIWFRIIWNKIKRADFVDVHGYVRGANPSLCWSNAKFDSVPLQWQGLNYLSCVSTLLDMLPAKYRPLEVVVSEFNHLWKTTEPDWGWQDSPAAGDVVSAFVRRTKEWNVKGHNPITMLCVYRWKGDEWSVNDNLFVLNAIKNNAKSLRP